MTQAARQEEKGSNNNGIYAARGNHLRALTGELETLGANDPGERNPDLVAPRLEDIAETRGDARERAIQAACVELNYLLKRAGARFARRLPSHVELDDLIGAGAVGLVSAVRQHVDKPMDELRRLAEQRIRGAVLDYLRSIDHLTRRQRAAVSAVNRAHLRLTQEQRATDSGAIAQTIGVTKARVEHIQNHLSVVQIHPIDDAETLKGSSPDPLQLAAHLEIKGKLVGALAELPERLQTILSLYYCENLTYKEIGDVMGISRSRICQLHTQAIDELRKQLRDEAA